MSNEAREAAHAFHKAGDALVVLGHGLTIGSALVSLGRQLRKITAREMQQEKLCVLRRPLDEMRSLLDALAATEQILRALLDGLTAVVGVDN